MSKIIINVGPSVDRVCEETYQFPEGNLHPSLVGDMMTRMCGFVERPGYEVSELQVRFLRGEEVFISVNTNSEVAVRRVLRLVRLGMLDAGEVEIWAHGSGKVKMVVSERGRLEWRGTFGFFREAFDEILK